MTSILDKMKHRWAELQQKEEQSLWDRIFRRARKDQNYGKHSKAAWMAHMHFGAGDYDPMQDWGDKQPKE